MSGLVGNSRRHVLSCRGSYVLYGTIRDGSKNKSGIYTHGKRLRNISFSDTLLRYKL